ncbi:hypothetical protein BDV26DRAFT_255831 [Aspergillus bertholletiae]|uniref:Fungal-type protein kinase domain-containing protein n=1 Tax=Aspergillus bertholletiae TaxID=1226010 RepID=A0A5N7BH92_9EURO|nr:hypothetical protein BDV26DRAFT_255831 [Aspergillus bertholletiae]
MVICPLKACTNRSIDAKAPDIIGMSPQGKLLFVYELRAPWVGAHDISRLDMKERKLRHILGQLAYYLHRSQRRSGFVTTYIYTIFVRQTVTNGQWMLEYSPPISYLDTSGIRRGDITARESF